MQFVTSKSRFEVRYPPSPSPFFLHYVLFIFLCVIFILSFYDCFFFEWLVLDTIILEELMDHRRKQEQFGGENDEFTSKLSEIKLEVFNLRQ